ncbi:hypothetical protein [Streptomyces sp. bgisy034]|uniref:hypothetical protein n=1 Tax=Streptomyces sp. bgisy034 TaxID=3413774 RepID=UPI003EBAC223
MTSTIDRIPVARSIRYIVRGAPEVPDEYNETRTIDPTEIKLTYLSTTDSYLGRIHVYVKGWWMHEGARVHAEAVGRHFTGDPAAWPEWLANEARLHDPERIPQRDVTRALILREAADFVGNDDTCDCGGCDSCVPNKLAAELRRKADEADPMVGSLARDGFGAHEIAETLSRPAAEQPAETCGQHDTETRQDDVWPVKESTRRYAETLRATPGQASRDGHTGWECDGGASLLVAAGTPGPGALGTHHGTIYACATHRDAAVDRITGAGFEADPQPAPPGHRWNPWPCGHVTAHDAKALTALTAVDTQQDGAQTSELPIVAYRSDGGRLLNCLRHVPPPAARHADFHPVTAEDLPDGGICTYPDCGVDVLIDQRRARKA